jgi:Xaa-Pro aminopeptidase
MEIKKGEQLFDSQRASLLMSEAGLDLVLASRRHSVAYLTGHFSIIYWEYPAVAHCLEKADDGCEGPYYFVGLPRDSSLAAFAVAHGAGIWKGRCWIEDIKDCCYRDESQNPVQQIVTSIEERGLARAAIGVEMNYMPAGTLKELERRLPQATFADAAPALWKMRMVKTERELARQREAYRMAERIYSEMFRALKENPGMTVGEARGLQMKLATEAGCPPLHFGYLFPQDGSQKRAWQTGDPRVPIQKGDVLLLDLGLICAGYTTDFGRVAVLGRASEKVKAAYQKVVEVRETMAAVIRPGVRACDVYQVGADFCERTMGHRPGGLGHGLGIECHEPPTLTPYDETVLEQGMTVVIEVGGGADGISFLLEDGGVITQAAWQSLTSWGTELIEIQ